MHICDITATFTISINSIEDMLRKKLISAIGKEVGPVEFSKYKVFHNRKLLKSGIQPCPFSYAIRRPDHFPEGVLSVEVQYPGESTSEPAYILVRRLEPEYPMQFHINAATKVSTESQEQVSS
jgi:hypothetical protein